MLLLVGLGNPTPDSENNRHNIGFKIIDAINNHFKLSKQKPKFKGLLTTGNIDEKKIRQKIIDEKLNQKDTLEYNLSEIVFSLENENLYESTYLKIKESINQLGFKITANKFSIADSGKFGGEIGNINENQLSNLIKGILKDTEVGEITKPILVANGYLILRVNEKNLINKSIPNDKDTTMGIRN